MTTSLGFSHLTFSRIKDLVNFPSPAALNEITYVASATNFRRCLLNQYGDDNIDIEREINTTPDTMATYLGYRRFLVSDLKYIFPLGASRSKTAYKKDVKFLAQQMLIRGYVRTSATALRRPTPDMTQMQPLTLDAGICRRCQSCLSQSLTPVHSPVHRRAQNLTQSSEYQNGIHDTVALQCGLDGHWRMAKRTKRRL